MNKFNNIDWREGKIPLLSFVSGFCLDGSSFNLGEANKEIIPWINEWNLHYDINSDVSLQEYLGFTKVEYLNWIIGRWDAIYILKRREFFAKLMFPIRFYYRTISFFEWRNLKQQIKFFGQRLFRGWDDSDTWSLDYSLAKQILPRLERLRQKIEQCPATPLLDDDDCKKWLDILDKMVFAFTKIIEQNDGEKMFSIDDERKENEKIQEGLDLFGKYYRNLWW
jgi:hypothetical protein